MKIKENFIIKIMIKNYFGIQTHIHKCPFCDKVIVLTWKDNNITSILLDQAILQLHNKKHCFLYDSYVTHVDGVKVDLEIEYMNTKNG